MASLKVRIDRLCCNDPQGRRQSFAVVARRRSIELPSALKEDSVDAIDIVADNVEPSSTGIEMDHKLEIARDITDPQYGFI